MPSLPWQNTALQSARASEALAAACVAHRGKSWAGAVALKRAPRLGQRGVVKRLDPTKQAVKVRFDSDGQTMWCARTSLSPRPQQPRQP